MILPPVVMIANYLSDLFVVLCLSGISPSGRFFSCNWGHGSGSLVGDWTGLDSIWLVSVIRKCNSLVYNIVLCGLKLFSVFTSPPTSSYSKLFFVKIQMNLKIVLFLPYNDDGGEVKTENSFNPQRTLLYTRLLHFVITDTSHKESNPVQPPTNEPEPGPQLMERIHPNGLIPRDHF